MKLIKYLTTTILLTLMLVSVTACGAKPEPIRLQSTKYGVVYNHYVCAVTVKLENEVIKSVSFDEAEAPYSWAKISNITTEIDEADKLSNSEYTGSGTNNIYANKIRIGNIIFSARTNGENNNYVDYYNANKNGETPFEDWLDSSDNAKWYFDNLTAGNYDVLKNDGTAYDVTFTAASTGELSKGERWLKSKNGYWPASETRKGWAANMNAIEEYLIAHGFEHYETERDTLEPNGSEIEINGVKTGATVVYFKDYINLALAAKNDALATQNNTPENNTDRRILLY